MPDNAVILGKRGPDPLSALQGASCQRFSESRTQLQIFGEAPPRYFARHTGSISMTGGWFSPRGLEGWGGVCGADNAPPSGSSFGNKHGVEAITTSSLDRRGQGTTASAGGGRTIMSTLRRNRRVVTEDGDGYECRSGKGGSGARRRRGVLYL